MASIADYDTLVAAVKVYAARQDSVFSARMGDFIALVEDRLYNGAGEPGEAIYSPPLRSRIMEVTDTLDLTDGTGDFPDDVLEVRRIYRADDEEGLTYQPPERLSVLAKQLEGWSYPKYFTVSGSTMRTAPAYTGSLTLDYYQQSAPITSSNQTGPLLTAHGMIYLEGMLFEAFSFMQETDLALGHLVKLRGMVAGANRSASALRFSGPMRTRPRVVFP